ncbi:MAG: hypothetical protein QOK14_220 [Frankiaceae bacterium]|nr:hypothetical protein [Frankiaceae bacterium]
MLALAISAQGEAAAVIDVPVTELTTGSIEVAVQAASVNGFDLAVAAGYVWQYMPHTFPVTLGKDFAGTVRAVGAGVTSVAVGDLVAGVNTLPALGTGTIAESFTVAADTVVPVPAGVTARQAAAVGLAGVTALDVIEALEVKPGDTLLISGATGGVGAFAVQLAVARGARVLATARPGDATDFVLALGAADVVDHTGDLAAAVRAAVPAGVSKAVHAAGDPALLADLLAKGGQLASLVGATAETVGRDDITVIPVRVAYTPAKLASLLEMVAAGGLEVPISATMTLDDAAEALTQFAKGKLGKVVVVNE